MISRARIVELMGQPITDSTIDDITAVYDDDDEIEEFDPKYLDLLINVVNAMRTGEFTIADLQSMID